MINSNSITCMKKNIRLFLISFLFLMAAVAQAEEASEGDFCCYEDGCCENQTNFYAKVLGGANFLQRTAMDGNKCRYRTGYFIAGSLGYCWYYGLRLEAEYTFRRNTIKNIDFFVEGSSTNGHYQASSWMGNLYWDIPLSSWGCAFLNINPYIGAGLGYDFQRMHATNSRLIFDQKWNHFSWQVMAGFSYPIFCHAEIALEYRFHKAGEHFYNQSAGVALLYKF